MKSSTYSLANSLSICWKNHRRISKEIHDEIPGGNTRSDREPKPDREVLLGFSGIIFVDNNYRRKKESKGNLNEFP